jgi:hypothetical protein
LFSGKSQPTSTLRFQFEGDWLATDLDGRIALFMGGESGPVPEAAAVDATENALTALDAATDAHRTQSKEDRAYRIAGRRPSDPIFDLPKTIKQKALHESPTTGYPHLVFGREGLREGVIEVATEEALVRDQGSFALIFPSLGPVLHRSIHESKLCRGCRTLDPPDDPRLRAPEVMAMSGLYTYLHPIEGDLYEQYEYFRVCSPSVPADQGDVEPLVASVASLVPVPFRFEDTPSVTVDQIRSLGPVSRRPRPPSRG